MLTITFQNISDIETTEPFLPYLPSVFKTTIFLNTFANQGSYSGDFNFSNSTPTNLKADIPWFHTLLIDDVEYKKCEDLGEVISTPYGYYLEDYDYTEGRVLYVNTGGRWLGGSFEQFNGVDVYQKIRFVRSLRFSYAHTHYIGLSEYLPRIKSVSNFGFEADHLFNSVLKEQSFSFVLDNADGFLDFVLYGVLERENTEVVVSAGEYADNQYDGNFTIESYEIGLNELRINCRDSRWRINDTIQLETFGELFDNRPYLYTIENEAVRDTKIPISFGTMKPIEYITVASKFEPYEVYLPVPDQDFSLTGYCLGYRETLSDYDELYYFVGRKIDLDKVLYSDDGGDVIGEILLDEETLYKTKTREKKKVYRTHPAGKEVIRYRSCWLEYHWGLYVIVRPFKLEEESEDWAVTDVNPVQCYYFTSLIDGEGGKGLNAKDLVDRLLNYGKQRASIYFVDFDKIKNEKYSMVIEDDYDIVDMIGSLQQNFKLSYFFKVHKSAITAYPNYASSSEASSIPELAVRDIDYYDIVKVSDISVKERGYNSISAVSPSYGMYEISRATSDAEPQLELSKFPVNKSTYVATCDSLSDIASYEMARFEQKIKRLSLTLSRLDYSLNIYGHLRVDLSKKILDSSVREFEGVIIVKILKIEHDISKEQTTISGYIES